MMFTHNVSPPSNTINSRRDLLPVTNANAKTTTELNIIMLPAVVVYSYRVLFLEDRVGKGAAGRFSLHKGGGPLCSTDAQTRSAWRGHQG